MCGFVVEWFVVGLNVVVKCWCCGGCWVVVLVFIVIFIGVFVVLDSCWVC